MSLITVEQALKEIRGADEVDEDELTETIEEASAAVVAYLKSASPYLPETDSNGDEVLDSNGDVVYTTNVRPQVRRAVKTLVSIMFRNRDENPELIYASGYLPAPVMWILYPLRDPALA